MSSEQKMQMLKQLLDDMLGNQYLYGGMVHRFKNYKIDDVKERVYLSTQLKDFDRDLESALEFLDKFQPYQKTIPTIYNNQPEITVPMPQLSAISAFAELKDILLDNIKKVQADKNYIAQAESIQANVISVIDLAKTEVAYVEAFAKLRKAGEV